MCESRQKHFLRHGSFIPVVKGKIGGDHGVPADHLGVASGQEGGYGRAVEKRENGGEEITVEKEFAVAREAEEEGLEEAEEVCEEVVGRVGGNRFVKQADGEWMR